MSGMATTEAEARKQLNTMLISAQKARSNGAESFGTDDDDIMLSVFARLHPWLWDEKKCVIPVLLKRLSDPRPIEPLEYYNWMFLAVKIESLISIGSLFYGPARLPDPEDLHPIIRWEN